MAKRRTRNTMVKRRRTSNKDPTKNRGEFRLI
jgi:hypothetical protein